MRAKVLGTFVLVSSSRDGSPGGRPGRLLEWLLLRPNETHGIDRLVELLWPGEAGTVADDVLRGRLYAVVSRLRRFLDDGDDDGLVLVTDDQGYRLAAGPAALDRAAFEADAASARRGDRRAAARAIALWRGTPYRRFRWFDEAQRQRRRLAEWESEVRQRIRDDDRDDMLPTPTRTKFLRRDVASEQAITRGRLLERLGPVGATSVLVVSAPAGYGKSVLLSQWAATRSAPVAWVALDATDDDPVRFWSAVLHALAGAGVVDVADMPTATTPGSRAFGLALTAALAAPPGPVGLVLDDVHQVTDPDLLAQVATTLRNLPDGVTVALGTRPPLPPDLASSVDRVTSSWLDAIDLAFDHDEVAEVVRGARGGVDTETLLARTDGWPLAVGLVGRRGDDGPPVDPDRVLDDYVAHELDRFVPDDVASFLLRTAFLDEFTVDLAATVVAADDVRSRLGWLRRHEGFVHEMGGWYRYHDLVRDALRRIAADTPSIDVGEAHRRAARWYRDQGRLEQALEQAVAGGDDDVVAEVAGQVLLSLVTRSEIRTCRHWLQTIDPDVLAADRGAHDLATLTAGGWLDRDGQAAWVRSRAVYGDDDLLVDMVDGHVAYLQGRARDCVAISDDCLGRVDAYFDAHPGLPGVRELATTTLTFSRMSARILSGELHHDAPELAALAKRARGRPVLSVWAFGELAFLAFVEGNTRLAADLVAEVTDDLGSMDQLSRCLGAGRLLAAQSLVESDASSTADTQRRIIRRLEPVAVEHRRLGWDVELVPVLLALQVAHHHLGELDTSAALSHEVDVLLDLCEDAPLLESARHQLDQRVGAGPLPVGTTPGQVLTPRERSVMAQLETSLTYDEIATRLGVSRHTVGEHLTSIYRKLGVRSRHGAVARYRFQS